MIALAVPAAAAEDAGMRNLLLFVPIAVFLLKTFDAKFWGVVIMGGVDIKV